MHDTIESTWRSCEDSILRSLERMRSLARLDGGDGVVDVVRGSEGIWQAWWLHADPATTPEVCSMFPDTVPLLDIAAGDAGGHWRDASELMQRGALRVRLTVPPAARTSTAVRAIVDDVIRAGVEVRVSANPRWFSVSRDRAVIVPLSWDDPTEDRSIVVRGRVWAQAFQEIFDQRWQQAEPWATDASQSVLHLLAEGHNDEQIATELGVSLRTVRRRIADHMESFEARSRFELGLRYGQSLIASA